MNGNKTSADGTEWDLTDLYQSKDDSQLKKDVKTAIKRAEVFADKRGCLASRKMTPKALFEAVAEYEGLCELMAKVESFVQLLYAKYREEGTSFVPKYLQLLKSGGPLSPKDLMARAGVDITDPNFWQDGLNMLAEYLEMAEDLVTKAGY